MSATWSLACATAVTLWLLPSSLYSEELKSGVAIPTTIVTDGSVKTESHGNTTVYLIDTAIHQKSSAHLTINGDFRIVTNGIVHIEEDASGKRIEVIPKKDATAELSTKQKAIVACTLAGGPPGGYYCHGVCEGTSQCLLTNTPTNRYCTCGRNKFFETHR